MAELGAAPPPEGVGELGLLVDRVGGADDVDAVSHVAETDLGVQ